MPKKSLTSISNDEDVIQELHWDTDTDKIEVVHEMNLEGGRNVTWTRKIIYSPEIDPAAFIRRCEDYGLDPTKQKKITEYIYTEDDESPNNEPHAVKFPENGDYYPLSDLPHLVAVILNAHQPTGGTSKTSGQALDT